MGSRPKRREFWRHGRHFDDPKDIVGQTFGELDVVEFLRKEPGREQNTYYYECQCRCGASVETTRWKLITGHTKSCGCRKKRAGRANPSWTGCGEISGKFWSDNRARAAKKGSAFDITIEEAWTLFEDQEGCCALSGVPLVMRDVWDNANRRYQGTRTASLDRIDNNQGYIVGNVRWVHKDVNRMKSDMPEKDFLRWCAAIAAHQQGARRGRTTG